MADFTALKNTIETYIKQNGNEEITGNILQEVLLAMVETLGDSAINDLITALSNEVTARQNADGTLQTNINNEATARGNADTALGGRIDGEITNRQNADTALQNAINGINTKLAEGYVYAGIATPSTNPSTPTGKVFYFATAAGTYTNFLDNNSAALIVTQGINILKFNGTAWSQEQILAIDAVLTAGSHNLSESGGVLESIERNALQEIYINQNTYPNVYKLSVSKGEKIFENQNKWYEGIYFSIAETPSSTSDYVYICNAYDTQEEALNACTGIKVYSNVSKSVIAVVNWNSAIRESGAIIFDNLHGLSLYNIDNKPLIYNYLKCGIKEMYVSSSVANYANIYIIACR